MSETIPEIKIDKSTWGEGPWQHEPDRLQWQHAGYACLIVRHSEFGNFCGYVGIDESHPLFGVHPHMSDVDLRVHRGANYGDFCDGAICHVPEPGMPERVWWIGFDCGHVGVDLSPGRNAIVHKVSPDLIEFAPHLYEGTYRALSYVKRQTESLAEQLRAQA